MPATITLKLGTNRGNRRIWIEGKRLTDAGFHPGTKFSVMYGADHVVMFASPVGARVVSKRVRDEKVIPIIDINAPEIASSLGADCERIEVTLSHETITATTAK